MQATRCYILGRNVDVKVGDVFHTMPPSYEVTWTDGLYIAVRSRYGDDEEVVLTREQFERLMYPGVC